MEAPGKHFPIIKHIDDVLPAIADAKEFFVSVRGGYTAIDYRYRTDETFGKMLNASPSEKAAYKLRRECRGIKFDTATGEVICRPYHKFFNLGELGEFLPQDVNWHESHHILEKLDGSMIAPARVSGAIRYMTRISDRDVAAQAASFAHNHDRIPYDGFANTMIEDGFTPIFEWCSRQQRIVIDYPEDRLVLTAMRGIQDGRYVPYERLVELAETNGVPVVGDARAAVGDTTTFLALTRNLLDSEGFIVRFSDGQMIKLKAEAYVSRHSALSDLSSEKRVMKIVLSNLDDDFGQLLDPGRRQKLELYAKGLRSNIATLEADLEAKIKQGWQSVEGDRKRFALEVAPTLPKQLQGVAFSVLDGKSCRDTLITMLDKHTNRAEDVDRIRPLINGLYWNPDLAALDE